RPACTPGSRRRTGRSPSHRRCSWERRRRPDPRRRIDNVVTSGGMREDRGVTETVRGRPTMKDVALAAGVAIKTVSRVVNEEPGDNTATAARVREAIERLGYRRNESARILRQGRTATIGLDIDDVADPFFSALNRAVENVAALHGSLVFGGSSAKGPQREREPVLSVCARSVDGLIIVPAGPDHSYLRPELDAGIVAVFADRSPGPGLDLDAVLCDNVGGARSGVEHLLRHGHRRI